jgi:hypothetical protein
MKYDIKTWELTESEKRIITFGERIFRHQLEIYDKRKIHMNVGTTQLGAHLSRALIGGKK